MISSYTYTQMDRNTSYDKIKHLVEIEDDIFAVFSINSEDYLLGFNKTKS